MKFHWFYGMFCVSPFSAHNKQRRTARGKTTQNTTHKHGKRTAPATHRASKKNQQKRHPNLTKNRPTTVSFSSLLPDRLRDRLGDLKKHPRERQKATRERPKRPQGLPRGPPDPPRGGPKWLKMQQRDLEPTLLGPRGAPRAAQEASRGRLGAFW